MIISNPGGLKMSASETVVPGQSRHWWCKECGQWREIPLPTTPLVSPESPQGSNRCPICNMFMVPNKPEPSTGS